MSILPVNSHPGSVNGHASPLQSHAPAWTAKSRVPLIFKRLTRIQSMDFELAAWQLTYLCIAPKRVYKNVYFHKQTKNTWARDDPAIMVLISACLAVAGIAWGIVWYSGIGAGIELASVMILRDYLLVGAIMATILWAISNRLLLSPPSHSTPADSRVEWAYAFDVHTNAFFPMFLTLYVAQLFLVPVILRDRWVCLWVGNTLYLIAFTQYIYGVYSGLKALPFLIRTEILLSPLLPLFASYIVSLVGFSVAKHVLNNYFRFS
ncbi:UNC-50-like protein [Punctularia strigosozonata HHB-11173 SS5]|uniref:UNC-50-like protein n=1 Tax=Punctularia strigosozonata (strain HHB-11173) TaxID=741275 RepID=UPI00044184D1|nr:UNC-50-like protein [Punctularia strigosozonata HHB-11173 SS5]EIN09032.1 UNC-50-like protein [Punctularia strigosozonata HHB-11173 SS5]